MTGSRRAFLKAGAAAGLGAAASPLAAPAVRSAAPIRWRLQTYAGPALAEHVAKPAVDAFNRAANGEMEIELFAADSLAPTGDLFRALRDGEIDAVQSDDDSMSAPTDVAVFGGYFPLALRHGLDVPTLFHRWGLAEIWEEAYAETGGVKWLSAGAWDPCHFVTREPVRRLADLEGKRVFTFPTAGRFLRRFGVVPVTLPWGAAADALRRGELDGVAWSGITEAYEVGWADAAGWFLSNALSGAWIGHFFVNESRWRALPGHLKALWRLAMDSSHYYRQHWYWGGEAELRVRGTKLRTTAVPPEEWRRVEAEAAVFWDEIAATSPRARRVVEIFRRYNAVMAEAGLPYRG